MMYTEQDMDEIKALAWSAEAKLRDRIAHLEKGIRDWLEGNYDNPHKYRLSGMCPHGVWSWQDCNACDAAHFERVLNECC